MPRKPGPSPRYPIRAVARLTGLSLDTLRAWERRYRAVTPVRDERGRLMVERLAELHRQVEGLVTEQIPITAGSPYDGRTLGSTQARSRTGASIVAVVRDAQVIVSPRPDFVFAAGDKVVVVGTGEGTAAVARIFSDG